MDIVVSKVNNARDVRATLSDLASLIGEQVTHAVYPDTMPKANLPGFVCGPCTARTNESLPYRTCVALDYEGGGKGRGVPLADVELLVTALEPFAYIAYSTYTVPKDSNEHRFRVVLPFSRNVLPHEWPAVSNALLLSFGQARIDRTCLTWSQYSLLPAAKASEAGGHWYIANAGDLWDVDAALARFPFAPTAPAAETRTDVELTDAYRAEALARARRSIAGWEPCVDGGRQFYSTRFHTLGGLSWQLPEGAAEDVFEEALAALELWHDASQALGADREWAELEHEARRAYAGGTRKPLPLDTDFLTAQAVNAISRKDLSPIEQELLDDPAAQGYSEAALAIRFARTYQDRVRYAQWCGWATWDGKIWRTGQLAPAHYVDEMVREIIKDMEENQFLASPDETDEQRKARAKQRQTVKALRSARALKGIADLARLQECLRVEPGDFDKNPADLNTPAGIVDLRTGTLRPHEPSAMCTRITSVSPSTSSARKWTDALLKMHPDDAGETVAYLQSILGHMIWGEASDGVTILQGGGQDGKSTILRVISKILGQYASPVTDRAFLRGSSDPHTSVIGGMIGARFGYCDELSDTARLDMGKIKSYFGSTPIRVQSGMGKDFAERMPTAKLLVVTNYDPQIDQNDTGTRRRVRLVRFRTNLLERWGLPRDDRFPTALAESEGSEILGWLIEGCREWFARGMQHPTAPAVSQEDTEELLVKSNQVVEWLDTVDGSEGSFSTTTELYVHYCSWCDLARLPPGPRYAFMARLEEAKVKQVRGGPRRSRGWQLKGR